MIFGAYDLNDLFQPGVWSGSPSQIFIHPEWNPFEARYDADIAAIIVDDEIPYTKFIRPICVSQTDLNINEGYVTGWGESEDKNKVHETIPKQLKIPIHENDRCFLESNQFVKIASLRTICGGDRKYSGPCRGDSGGGLFVKKGDAFFLKGLVSASLTNAGQCDVTNFALYTNVDKFTSWIDSPTEELLAVKPSGVSQQGYVTSQPSYTQASYAISTSRPTTTSSTCGMMSNIQSLIQGGDFSPRGQFPWTVATSIKQPNGNFVYFSTGTLISDRHIVSTGLAAAYLDGGTQRYIARNPNDFRLLFGVSDLNQAPDATSFTIDGVAQVILHPSIRHGSPRLANVGVLILRNGIQFNRNVAPVCLPTETIDLEEFEGRNSMAVGWGQDDTGNDSRTRKYANLKISSDQVCSHHWESFLRNAAHHKFFCAGGGGFKSACYRDQPLYLKNEGRWYLRALISVALGAQNGKCDLNSPVLYEDIGQYYEWLKALIDGEDIVRVGSRF